MIEVVAVINNKGGVGKTTTTVNLAASLARKGRRVLLIDLDSQGSASLAMGVERRELSPSSAEVLFGEIDPLQAVRSDGSGGFDLLTGSPRLSRAERHLADTSGQEERLRSVLPTLRTVYDIILIDCAPSLSLLTTNALVGADAFIVPVTPSYLALEGVAGLSDVVRDVRRRMGRVAPILGVLLTMVPPEPDHTQQLIIQKLRQHYGGKVFDTMVHLDAALERAPIRGQSIFDYDNTTTGAKEYGRLSSEVEDRLERYGAVYAPLKQ